MANRYWLITNRNVNKNNTSFGADLAAQATYWVSEGGRSLAEFAAWRKVEPEEFQKLLVKAAERFPMIDDPALHEDQKHVTLFIHGYNNTWDEAAHRYQQLCQSMFTGDAGLGQCVMFTWPSDGSAANYLPDRSDARASAEHLADVLSRLYDWLVRKQADAALDDRKACRAKTSIIAHSMGNYLVQNAMQIAWTRKNQPLLVSLINQLIMVAADVDNDIFDSGESVGRGDAEGLMNLTYRITSLFSGRDPILGLSAGLKHFGKRRLGRSGLSDPSRVPGNVWEVDCSPLFHAGQKNIHAAYFEVDRTINLMRQILRGADRRELAANLR